MYDRSSCVPATAEAAWMSWSAMSRLRRPPPRRWRGHGDDRGETIMTTPHGEAPLTGTRPNGRKQAKPAARGRRPKAAEAQAVEEQPRRAQAAEPRENLADTAAQLAGGAEGAEAVLGSGLLAGSGLAPVAGALRSLGQVAMRPPRALLRSGRKIGLQFLQIGLGKSEVAPQ